MLISKVQWVDAYVLGCVGMSVLEQILKFSSRRLTEQFLASVEYVGEMGGAPFSGQEWGADREYSKNRGPQAGAHLNKSRVKGQWLV